MYPEAEDRNAGRTGAVPVVNGGRLVVDFLARKVNASADHRRIVSYREDVDPAHDDDQDGVDCDHDDGSDCVTFSDLLDPSTDCGGVLLVVISSDFAACALPFAKSIDHAVAVLFLSIHRTLSLLIFCFCVLLISNDQAGGK